MSWFLRCNVMTESKKKKLLLSVVFCVLPFCLLILFCGLLWGTLISMCYVLFLFLNLWVKKRISWNADHMFSDIDRNYDYLLIGEPWDYSDLKGRVIAFFSPNRSLLSSFELTRRLYSLLREETGTLIISCEERSITSQQLSVLDIPYLHEIQLYQYRIGKSKLKKYFPFLFAPLATLKFIFAKKCKEQSVISTDVCPQLRDFCKERNIKLKIINTK